MLMLSNSSTPSTCSPMRSKSNDYVTSLSRKKPHNRNDKEQLTFTERERWDQCDRWTRDWEAWSVIIEPTGECVYESRSVIPKVTASHTHIFLHSLPEHTLMSNPIFIYICIHTTSQNMEYFKVSERVSYAY